MNPVANTERCSNGRAGEACSAPQGFLSRMDELLAECTCFPCTLKSLLKSLCSGPDPLQVLARVGEVMRVASPRLVELVFPEENKVFSSHCVGTGGADSANQDVGSVSTLTSAFKSSRTVSRKRLLLKPCHLHCHLSSSWDSLERQNRHGVGMAG